jgi:hypothetical protein
VTVRLFLAGERVGPQLARSANKNIKKILAAERGAAKDTVEYVVPRARTDIASAGNFGSRWTNGFNGKISEGGGFIRVAFTEKVPYWRVFQFGATIHGRPLLWIPLSFAKDAQGINARDYPGKLFRVNRKNGKAPLLMKAGRPAEPKYFGKESVKIPKKFHLVEIIRDGAKKLKSFYRERMKNG